MIFVENLNIKTLINILIFLILKKSKFKFTNNKINLYVLDNYNIIIFHFAKLLFNKVSLFDFKFNDLTSLKQPKIGFDSQYQKLNNLVDIICKSSKIYNKNNIFSFYLKKNISAVNGGPLFRKIYIAEVINWYFKNANNTKIFISDNNLFKNALVNFYITYDIKFISFEIINYFRYLSFYNYFDKKYNIEKNIFDTKNLSILVRNFKNINFEDNNLVSDIIFYETNYFKKHSISIYTEGFDLDTKDKEYLNNNKINNVTLKKKHNFKIFNNNLFKKYIGNTHFKSAEINYLNKLYTEYKNKKNYYSQILLESNSKISFTHFKFNSDHIPLHHAINDIGGISTMWQLSYEELSTYDLSIISDIYFSQSNYNIIAELNNKSKILSNIIVGYPGDYRFKYLKNKKNKSDKIISFFDENTSNNEKWAYGDNQNLQDYSFLLEKILNDRNLLVYFKPKKSETLLKRLSPIKNLLDKAMNTKRLFIISGNHNSFPPSFTSLKSNLAIHNSLYAATAGIESILSGTTTFYLDHDNWNISKLNEYGKNKFIFNNWDNLWENVEDYFNYKREYSEYHGNDFLNYLDPYRDGKSSIRIASYLKNLKIGLEKKLKKDDILNYANSEFKKNWSSDKVVTYY